MVTKSIPPEKSEALGDPLLRPTDYSAIAWVVITVWLFAWDPYPAISPIPTVYTDVAIMLALGVLIAVGHDDVDVLNLLAVGLIAGVLELAADAFLVDVAGVLVYDSDLMLWASPAWMPLAWTVIIAQIGYLAHRLDDHSARGLVPGVAALLYVGAFEVFAPTVGAWEYVAAPLGFILGVPAFVLVAELVMFSTLWYALRRRVIVAGVGFGLTILVAYVGTWAVFTTVSLLLGA